MERLFAVIRTRGARWKASRPLEKQAAWQPHAVFMNRLAAAGFVVLGGPLAGTRDVLLIVRARDARSVRARLARDPWSRQGLLAVQSVTPWTLRPGKALDRPRREPPKANKSQGISQEKPTSRPRKANPKGRKSQSKPIQGNPRQSKAIKANQSQGKPRVFASLAFRPGP